MVGCGDINPPPQNDQTQKTLYCFKSNKILYVFIGDISGYSGYITSIFGFKTSCSLYRSVKIQGRIVEMKIPLGYKELGRKIKKEKHGERLVEDRLGLP